MAQSQSTRALALARRKAMSTAGKGATSGNSPERTRADTETKPTATAAVAAAAPARPRARYVASSTQSGGSSRAVALARRKAMSVQGKRADTSTDRTTTGGPKARKAAAMATAAAPEVNEDGDCGCGCKGRKRDDEATPSTPQRSVRAARAKAGTRRSAAHSNPTRAAALARRQAQSTRGKAGVNGGGVSAAQTARAANPGLTSRELARELRELRSRNGKSRSTQQCGDCSGKRRQRPKDSEQGAAQDQPWKVGVSETSHGQAVTGTMVGRSPSVTGDEPSTCRAVTGTEYLGADLFRSFCQTEPARTPLRVGTSRTGRDNTVTGNEVGRSGKVTGDEPGTCKRITGNDYVSPDQTQAFCGTKPEPNPAKVTRVETTKGKAVTGSNVGRSAKVTGDEAGADRATTGTQYTRPSDIGNAPHKVGASATLRGGAVTGTMVGRRQSMTGDEAGSCRNVTGDDYIGREQFNDFCSATPAPQDQKVGVSSTSGGKDVTGTMTGRSERVTGDEPGTCKAITGTPYAGLDQAAAYCESPQLQEVQQRTRPSPRQAGMPMTGLQPGVGGKMTGADKGACETVSGTPYVGADQVADACAATPAEPGSADFPQPLGNVPWGDFSVEPPAHATEGQRQTLAVTGSRYEQGHITGPFGMAAGKVTGTEEKRFGAAADAAPAVPDVRPEIQGRVASRITGEGMDAGPRITGDDWDRGDHVTGTEGSSATRRNPTQRGGPMSAMEFRRLEPRNDAMPDPVSKVTGSSGNTEAGSLITYSGGARG
ncbi:MAG: CsoS2 family carboxysome shell protein [Gammaproteobacteria bacterium]|nr:CsoS2 family carboxysome shell protein [Gammaproteobacteria bacterium]